MINQLNTQFRRLMPMLNDMRYRIKFQKKKKAAVSLWKVTMKRSLNAGQS
ncbi:hypothetical protein PO124_31110 [Bacillus licheniformis]|nr:hypothetical protein [Bacillus licheniformis]